MHPLPYSACQGTLLISSLRVVGADYFTHQCEPNEADQENPLAACKTCLKVDKTSKKTIHNIPCLRFKLTSVVIYRAGGLQLTERFTHTEVKDVASFGPTFEMKMSQGLCRKPVTLRIREFVPKQGDVLHRKFASNGGDKSIVEIPPFCLQDVGKTAKDFTQYILANSLDGLEEAGMGEPEIVRRTLAMIRRHCQELPVSGSGVQFHPCPAEVGTRLTSCVIDGLCSRIHNKSVQLAEGTHDCCCQPLVCHS